MTVLKILMNRIPIMEEYICFFNDNGGRGSLVEKLTLDDINEDLKYFDEKLKRGLKIPSSYLNTNIISPMLNQVERTFNKLFEKRYKN